MHLRAYVITTGLIFVLVLAAHVARVFAEGFHLVTEPTFAFTSLLSLAVSIWAWRVFRGSSKPNEKAQPDDSPNYGPAGSAGNSDGSGEGRHR
jgi:hypothetical protein